MLLKLARQSLWSRRGTAALCVLSLAISVFVLLGVEFIRSEARNAFGRTLSGTDLIVGARGGQLNLLLYSVFRIGEPSNNIRWQSYRDIASNPAVAWTVPISLGDSHRGYRVLGTTGAYFRHYRYDSDRPLELRAGTSGLGEHQAVIGATVADQLGYGVGTEIVLAHGTGGVSFHQHDEHPFTVSGVLARTGTPVDDTVHISLHAMDHLHEGMGAGGRTITAFLLGLETPVLAFRLQREINEYAQEPLQAILPGVALAQLWRMLGSVESLLRLVSGLVLGSALLGMSTMLLASLRERRGELAVLRSIGASPLFILLLLEAEALLLALLGLLCGMAATALASLLAQDWLRERFGLLLGAYVPGTQTLQLAALVLLLALLCAAIPAISAYRAARSPALPDARI